MGDLGSVVVKDLTQDPSAPPDKAVLQNVPDDLATCAQGHGWLANQGTWPKRDDFLSKFDERCKTSAKTRVLALTSDLSNINKQLDDADLLLFKPVNALRQLSNLKPSISNKVADERKQAEEPPMPCRQKPRPQVRKEIELPGTFNQRKLVCMVT